MNELGIQPVEYKVVIRPDEQGETLGKLGLIIVPDTSKDRFALEKCEGVLIAVGGNAFIDWKDPIPKVGDRVYFAKYAGIRLRKDVQDNGKPKRIDYVLCNDKDIAAILQGSLEENKAKPDRTFS